MWNNTVAVLRRNASILSVLVLYFVLVVESQWPNYDLVRTRLPGKCSHGEFDCLIGPCIPSYKFNDGHPDCLDGSDEFCFAGHIRCGKQCVDISYAGECLANPNCDGTQNAPSFCGSTKTKLCDRSDVMRCKGYNECVLRKWVLDDNDDCFDGSDSDVEYVTLMNGIYFDHFPSESSTKLWTLLPFRPRTQTTSTVSPLPTTFQPSVAISSTPVPSKTASVPSTAATHSPTVTSASKTTLSTTSTVTVSPLTTTGISSASASSTNYTTSTKPHVFTEPVSTVPTAGVPLVTHINGSVRNLTTLKPPVTVTYPTNRNLTCYENATLLAALNYPVVQCRCPPGQMETKNGSCITIDVATFSAKVSKVCGNTNVRPEDEPNLTVAKLSEALEQSVCVRKLGTPLILNTVCDKCNITDLQALLSRNESKSDLVRMRLSEVEAGGCFEFDINDCDEKAQCLPEGLHYRCLCLPGTNDTTDGSGRHCDGVVIATSCRQFLGVCILFWILLLLLLLLLIPAAYMAYQYFRKKRTAARKKLAQHRVIEVRPLSPSKRISADSAVVKTAASGMLSMPTAIPTTSHLSASTSQATWKQPIPETIITAASNTKEYEIIEDAESVSSSEPEVVSLQSNKSAESLKFVELPPPAPAPANVVTETVIPVEIHNERRSSTRSEGVPTIWESFKILGKQYSRVDSAKSRKSSTASLESLIRKSEYFKILETAKAPAPHPPPAHGDELHLISSSSQPNILELTHEPDVTQVTTSTVTQEAARQSRPPSTVPVPPESDANVKLASMLGMNVSELSQSSMEAPLQPSEASESIVQAEQRQSPPAKSPEVKELEDNVPLFTELAPIATTEDIINMAAENVALKATLEAIEDSVEITSSEELPSAPPEKPQSSGRKSRGKASTPRMQKQKELLVQTTDESTSEETSLSSTKRKELEESSSASAELFPVVKKSPKVTRNQSQTDRRLSLPKKPKVDKKEEPKPIPKPKELEAARLRKPPLYRRKPPSRPAQLSHRLERIEESDSVVTDNEQKQEKRKDEHDVSVEDSKTRVSVPKSTESKKRLSPVRPIPAKVAEKVQKAPEVKKPVVAPLPPIKSAVRRQWDMSDYSANEQLSSDAEFAEDLKLVLGKVDLDARKNLTNFERSRKHIRSGPSSRRPSQSLHPEDRSPRHRPVSSSCPQTSRLPSELHMYKSKDNLYKSRLPIRQNRIEESLQRLNCRYTNDEFVAADIDIDIPGPFTYPVDFNEMEREKRRSLFGSQSSLHGSSIPRPVKPFSSEQDIHSKMGGENRRRVSNLARKIANRRKQDFLPPLNGVSSARTPTMSYRDWGSPVSSRKSVKSCNVDLGDRPRWDTSPLRDGELEKIPLDFALTPRKRLPTLAPSNRPRSEHVSRWIQSDDRESFGPEAESRPKRSRSLTSLFKRSKVTPSESAYWNYEVKKLREHHWWSDE